MEPLSPRRHISASNGACQAGIPANWESVNRFQSALAPLQLNGMFYPPTTSVHAMERLAVDRPLEAFSGIYDKLSAIIKEEDIKDQQRKSARRPSSTAPKSYPGDLAAPSRSPVGTRGPSTPLYRYLAKYRITPMVLVFTDTAPPPLNYLPALKYFLENKTLNPSIQPHWGGELVTDFTFYFPPPPWELEKPLKVKFISTALIPRLAKREWCGIIAAFIGHQEWIFRSLPLPSPIDAAHTMRLFFVRWTDPQDEPRWFDQLPIKSWQISRASRHQDFMLWTEIHEALKERLQRPYEENMFYKLITPKHPHT